MANHRPGKPDKLSQHAVAKSQAREARQAIPVCIANMHSIKEAVRAQNSGQADTAK